jgi:hypothetical protein
MPAVLEVARAEQASWLSEREMYDSRWLQLDTEFGSWKTHWQDLSTYILPRNGRFVEREDRGARGQKKHNSIYDNTGTRSVRVVGSGLMAGATSPARAWVRIVTGDPVLNRQQAVKLWLDEVTKLVLKVFAKGNTYRVLHTMYEELAVFGTAACIVLPDPENVLHCYPLAPGEYRLATDYKGAVNTCYRRFTKTVAETVREFGWENCSSSVQQLFDKGFLSNAVQICHVIEPRDDRDPEKVDNLNMPWKSIYYEVGVNEGKWLRESGFENFPVLAPRWAADSCETYGSSPGMEALGDVKQLQHEQLRKAENIDFKTKPSMLAPTEAKANVLKWTPGGVNYVNSLTPSTGVRPAFESTVDLSHLLEDIRDVRDRIRASFFADLFLMLSFAGVDTRMTAREVAERHEEKLIQLGPVLERLHTELLAPLVNLAYLELEAAGLLPPEPPEIGTSGLTLEFISMLAQAQRAVGVAGVERMLTIAGSVQQVKPDMIDNLDEDELWSELSDMIGVTPRISRSPEARNKLRQARIAAQNAAAQSQMAQQNSETAKNLAASPTDQNNALRDVMSLFSGYNQPPAQAYS